MLFALCLRAQFRAHATFCQRHVAFSVRDRAWLPVSEWSFIFYLFEHGPERSSLSARALVPSSWCTWCAIFGPTLFVSDVDYWTFGGSQDVVGHQATPSRDMFSPVVHRATDFLEELIAYLVVHMEPPVKSRVNLVSRIRPEVLGIDHPGPQDIPGADAPHVRPVSL